MLRMKGEKIDNDSLRGKRRYICRNGVVSKFV